jgi:hypothetical protein
MSYTLASLILFKEVKEIARRVEPIPKKISNIHRRWRRTY